MKEGIKKQNEDIPKDYTICISCPDFGKDPIPEDIGKRLLKIRGFTLPDVEKLFSIMKKNN